MAGEKTVGRDRMRAGRPRSQAKADAVGGGSRAARLVPCGKGRRLVEFGLLRRGAAGTQDTREVGSFHGFSG